MSVFRREGAEMFSFLSSNRKAQGMSLNVIVVAVIALVIIVVLIFLMTGKTRFFGKAIMTCEAKGGRCAPECTSSEISHLGTNCPADSEAGTQPGPKCCSPFDAEPAQPATAAPAATKTAESDS